VNLWHFQGGYRLKFFRRNLKSDNLQRKKEKEKESQ